MGGRAVVPIAVEGVESMDACGPVDVDSDGTETVLQAVATINNSTATTIKFFYTTPCAES